jgi:hypothetical protein
MRRASLLGVVMALAIGLTACGTIDIFLGQSAKEAYLGASLEFNDLVRQYEQYYQEADTELKAELKDNVDPLILKGDTVLDAWALALALGQPTAENQQEWINLKNEIIDALASLAPEDK